MTEEDQNSNFTDYIYAGGQKIAKITTPATGAGVVNYYLDDHLGTTQVELDSSGYVTWQGQFTPFGAELADGSTSMHYKFTGKDSDSTHSHAGFLKAEGVTMERLASSLTSSSSAELGRVVINKTGLTGKYDFTLRWTPVTGRPPVLNGEPDTSAPSIFTAIQEQLGLKLESTKASVPVLVIDHAELPSQN